MNDALSPKSRARRLVALFVLACTWYAAVWHQPLPSSVDVGARGAELERVFATLEFLTRDQRQRGTTHHAASIEHLEERLRAAGHVPRRQEARLFAAPIVNVLAEVAGRESTGLVLVMAHHDSVFASPGAGDDASGVAAALEAFTSVAATGPRNDLLLLLTDGEELDLLGATAFVEQHPRAGEVRAVVNLEALGNAGPAWLFETGPEDGRWVEAFARTAPLPIGSSAAEAIYRTLMSHRDTDFSRLRDRGVGGFNFAIVWGTAANHRPIDTFANIERAAVAHLYDSGRAALAVLAEADLAAEPRPGSVFFELPGLGLVAIAPLASRVLSVLALAAALAVAALAVRGVGPRRVLGGLAFGLVACAVAVAATLGVVHALPPLAELVASAGEVRGNALSMRLFAAGAASLAAGLCALPLLARRVESGWFLVPGAVGVVALEATFPQAAHALAVPVLAVATATLAPPRLRDAASLAALVLAVLFAGPYLRSLPQIVGTQPTMAALASAVPAAALAALALVPLGPSVRARAALVLAVAGLVLLAAWALVARGGL